MYFKKLILHGFGQFSNKELTFKPGMNLLLGQNEKGKSTILNSIYGIFFGFINLKNLYLPWHNPTQYEASLECEHEGENFKLTRNFLNDEVTLSSSGEQFKAKISPQGRRSEREIYYNKIEKFFGFSDPELFRKTLYIGQGELPRKTTEEEGVKLKTLLSGLSEHNYDEIVNLLEEKYFSITKENPNGMDKRNNRILEELHEKKTLLQNQLKTSEEAYTFVEKQKTENNLLEKKTKEDKEKLIQLEKEGTLLQELSDLSEKEKSHSKDFSEKSKIQKQRQEFEIKIDFLKKQTSFPKYYYYLPFAGFLLIYWWFIAIPSILLLSFFSFTKWREKNLHRLELLQMQSKLEMLPLQRKIDEEATQLSQELFILQEKKKKIHTENPHLLKLTSSQAIQQKIFETSNNVKKLKIDLERNLKKLYETQKDLAVFQKGMTPPSRLYEETQLIEEQEGNLKNKAQSLYEAKKTLGEAIEAYRGTHFQRLSEEISSLFSEMTQNKHNEILIDDTFHANIKNKSSYFPSVHLSYGTREQLYFALRFILIKKLAQDRKIPLLIDDSFVHFDTERQKKCCELIEKFSSENQIILASHHKDYNQYFKKAHIINL